ncbi:MAG: hypothetical protein BGO49_02120 [Planctomycetales bacterium 71-10]|nr:MAG: hypothetical protein BGO49_02120 [Planctomycetales bacterium 71-10]
MKGENERLTGDLKDVVGEVIAPGLAVELDAMGAVHVAVFRLARDVIGDRESLTLEVPGGRAIDLFVLRDSYQPDGTIRAAVVNDSGRPGYGLGLEPSDGG